MRTPITFAAGFVISTYNFSEYKPTFNYKFHIKYTRLYWNKYR